MKRMRMGLALLVGAALMAPSAAAAQVRMVGVFQCDEGEAQGDLGISGLDCRGDCTLTMNEKGEEQAWSFTVEPRINGISPGGAADGLLRVGDFLVAIDGIPITTRDGGVRYANVEPGQEVDILVRREGKLERVMIQAGSICLPPPPRHLSPAPLLPPRETLAVEAVSPPPPRVVTVVTVGRLAPPLPPDTLLPTRLRTLGVAVAPRVRVTPVRRGTLVSEAFDTLSTLPRRTTTGLLARLSPTGRLGIGFSCTECGTQTNEETGENVWFFSGPLEVTTVRAGGPADKAGIQRGDLIKAIDGHSIDTEKGGLAFTRLWPGERVRMTVVKRNGSEVEVGLVPEAAVAVGVGARASVPVEEVAVVPPLPPALPTRADVPAPTAVVNPPEGMPLRYSGVIGGVEVEVRGNPVTVSEMRGARTILINAEGLWIRISIPRERE